MSVPLVLGVAACSAADAPPVAPDRGAAGARQPAQTSDRADDSRRIDPRRGGLELGFGEFAITLEADEIRPGPVTFVVRNGGQLVHGFETKIEEIGGDGGHDDDGRDERFEFEGEPLGPGEIIRIPTDLGPGTYEVECFVAEHDDLGMRATLMVRRGAPLAPVEKQPGNGDAVTIEAFAFSPRDIEVAAGTEVTWSNTDPAAHTVTAEGGAFDSGTLEPGSDFSARFTEVGTYAYLCQIHPAMRGTLRVA